MTYASGFRLRGLGQMRPNNRSTMINDDLVGTTHDATSWPSCTWPRERHEDHRGGQRRGDRRRHSGVVRAGALRTAGGGGDVRLQGPLRGPASLYEQAYLSIFERLLRDGRRLHVPVSRRGRRRTGRRAWATASSSSTATGASSRHAQRRQRTAPDGHLRAGRRSDAPRVGTARAKCRASVGVRHPDDGRDRPRT